MGAFHTISLGPCKPENTRLTGPLVASNAPPARTIPKIPIERHQMKNQVRQKPDMLLSLVGDMSRWPDTRAPLPLRSWFQSGRLARHPRLEHPVGQTGGAGRVDEEIVLPRQVFDQGGALLKTDAVEGEHAVAAPQKQVDHRLT